MPGLPASRCTCSFLTFGPKISTHPFMLVSCVFIKTQPFLNPISHRHSILLYFSI
jgi:hypothetical protein